MLSDFLAYTMAGRVAAQEHVALLARDGEASLSCCSLRFVACWDVGTSKGSGSGSGKKQTLQAHLISVLLSLCNAAVNSVTVELLAACNTVSK